MCSLILSVVVVYIRLTHLLHYTIQTVDGSVLKFLEVLSTLFPYVLD